MCDFISANNFTVSTLATHASGLGSKTRSQRKKERLIYLVLNIMGVPLLARISRNAEVPSTLTIKEPSEDEKHSGSDHLWRFTQYINTGPLWSSGEEV